MNSKHLRIHVRFMIYDLLAKLDIALDDDDLAMIADELEAEANDLPEGDNCIFGLKAMANLCRSFKEN